MKIEQYKQKIKELNDEYNSKMISLNELFALENNPAKQGDILEDHYQRIIYERHRIVQPGILNLPAIAFYGFKIKTNGKPFKSGEKSWLYQNNLKKVNGVPI